MAKVRTFERRKEQSVGDFPGTGAVGNGADKHSPLGVNSEGKEFRTFIRWQHDWSNVTELIKAELTIRSTSSDNHISKKASNLQVWAVNNTFDEGGGGENYWETNPSGGDTWDTMPGRSNRQDFSVGGGDGVDHVLDVTDIVKDWANSSIIVPGGVGGGKTNYGLAFAVDSGDAWEFQSIRGSNKPKLAITYTEATKPTIDFDSPSDDDAAWVTVLGVSDPVGELRAQLGWTVSLGATDSELTTHEWSLDPWPAVTSDLSPSSLAGFSDTPGAMWSEPSPGVFRLDGDGVSTGWNARLMHRLFASVKAGESLKVSGIFANVADATGWSLNVLYFNPAGTWIATGAVINPVVDGFFSADLVVPEDALEVRIALQGPNASSAVMELHDYVIERSGLVAGSTIPADSLSPIIDTPALVPGGTYTLTVTAEGDSGAGVTTRSKAFIFPVGEAIHVVNLGLDPSNVGASRALTFTNNDPVSTHYALSSDGTIAGKSTDWSDQVPEPGDGPWWLLIRTRIQRVIPGYVPAVPDGLDKYTVNWRATL